jgi:hypothetical protein
VESRFRLRGIDDDQQKVRRNPDEKSPDFNRFQWGALFLQVNCR